MKLDWNNDYRSCRKEMPEKEIKEISNYRILILAPHSDDEWVGCSQLLQNKKNEITVLNMDMEGGDSEELHKTRFEEMQNLSEKYGYSLIKISEDKVEFLSGYLESNVVDVIMVPCYFDWHPEHIEVMHILNQAAAKAGYQNRIAMYQVSLPIPYMLITHGNGLNRGMANEKWKDLKNYYPTQKHLPTKRFLLNERINGGMTKTYALESYSVIDYQKWAEDLNKYELNVVQRDFLYKNIQNIKLVRDEIEAQIKVEK